MKNLSKWYGLLLLSLSISLASCTSSDDHSSSEVIQRGIASWYGERFHGKQTANGETYNMHEMTAAHKKLPFGTEVEVKSLSTGKTVQVRINDRGPFIEGRVIDLSYAAAQKLGIVDKGQVKVEISGVEN